ncbi:helix-turn-helix domain-containing protein [Micromonospora craniellae]|uniref:XRE family transcriptional regulator n=1 Tax=Micromonospora craniellae TaxID=2294034 RepID=A0A372G3U6_9ACTN|nr:helix-turn-helix transcriptional regulator [Micromonospora craniellae]RFS47584.1 XRE family transcriptional regulator [Micromonospora craniellae]
METLPVGRRVAYWRGRRKLSQQVFADRLGKSKSWVDKVERGVRSLDKVSTLQEVATVLRIDTAVLLGRDVQPTDVSDRTADVERAHAADPMAGRGSLVEAYRITASLLVKLGEPDLAWLAVDRAMTAASRDRILVAAAAVQLGQVLRGCGQVRAARSAMLAAAYRIVPPTIKDGTPAELSLGGALLVQAALAAARSGDEAAVVDLFGEATALAAQVGDGHDHHRTGFGPTAVQTARVTAAVELGDGGDAVAWHEKTTDRDGWRWLPVEYRAAHLIDAARAYLHTDDPVSAGRALMEADRMAPAEVRHRPAGRDVLAQIVRDPTAPTTLVHLAATVGVG